MSSEFLSPLYISDEIARENCMVLRRRNTPQGRVYYAIDENGQFFDFPSVTTILDQTVNKGYGYEYWLKNSTPEQIDKTRVESANYGTLLHIVISRFLIDGVIDFDTFAARVESYCYDHKLSVNQYEWTNRLKKDIRAFQEFARNFNLEPDAIEISLASIELGYSGTIDFVGTIKIGTGKNGNILKKDVKYDDDGVVVEDNRIKRRVIIDWKSSTKGTFYKSHEIQLHMYKKLWETNFPNYPIDDVFNWSPKDWREKPSYTFKDQTQSIYRSFLNRYTDEYFIENRRDVPTYPRLTGKIRLDRPYEDMQFESLHDILKRRAGFVEPIEEEEENVATE